MSWLIGRVGLIVGGRWVTAAVCVVVDPVVLNGRNANRVKGHGQADPSSSAVSAPLMNIILVSGPKGWHTKVQPVQNAWHRSGPV